jgi:TRAP-type C4-dicarboxylate transport system permease small subunit
VDVVHRAVPPKIRIVLEYFVNIVAIVFCLVLAYFSYRQMMRVYISGQISPAMELPMWLPYLSIPVGSVLMAIRYLGEFWRRIRNDRSKASRIG